MAKQRTKAELVEENQMLLAENKKYHSERNMVVEDMDRARKERHRALEHARDMVDEKRRLESVLANIDLVIASRIAVIRPTDKPPATAAAAISQPESEELKLLRYLRADLLKTGDGGESPIVTGRHPFHPRLDEESLRSGKAIEAIIREINGCDRNG